MRFTFTFTFIHLADAFIQSDLQMITLEAVKLTAGQQNVSAITFHSLIQRRTRNIIFIFYFFLNIKEEKVLVLLEQVLPKEMRLQLFLKNDYGLSSSG